MGSFLSKGKSDKGKVAPLDTRATSSAPARLENLEGTSPSNKVAGRDIHTPEPDGKRNPDPRPGKHQVIALASARVLAI